MKMIQYSLVVYVEWCVCECKGDTESLFTAVEPMQTADRELFKNNEGWESLLVRVHQDEQRMLRWAKGRRIIM